MFEDISGAEIKRQLGDVFLKATPVRIRFSKIRFFDGDPMVVWTAPSDISRLQALHHAVHSKVDAALCRANYLPGSWTPHCTLATQIDPAKRDEAIEFINAGVGEFDVVFNAIEVIEFSPIELVQQWRLDL